MDGLQQQAALVHLACLYRGGSADVCFLIMCMSSKCVESLAHGYMAQEKMAEMADLVVDAPGQMVVASGVDAALGGLYEAWDAQKDLREQFRLVKRLLVEKPAEGNSIEKTAAAISRTAVNLRFNSAAVEPLCWKMRNAPQSVPCIDALHKEVQKFHNAHGVHSDFKTIQDEAWSLRYMFGLVKQLTYKQGPPRDA